MALYTYRCPCCGSEADVRMSMDMAGKTDIRCTPCGGTMRRVYNPADIRRQLNTKKKGPSIITAGRESY